MASVPQKRSPPQATDENLFDRLSTLVSPGLQRWIAASLWGTIGALACARMIGLEPNMVEEGLVLHFAQRLAHGEQLYRDLVFFSGPLPFEWLGVLFRLFGEKIMVGRITMVGLHGLTTAATFLFLHRQGLRAMAHPATLLMAAVPILLFPLFSIFWYTTIAFYLCVLAGFAAFLGVRSVRWAIVAGLLVGAVALCKQSIGVMLATELVVALAVLAPRGRKLRQSGALILGGSLAAATTLGIYGLRGTLPDMYRCLVTIPLSLGKSYTAPFMNLWPPGVLGPEVISNKVLYLPQFWFLAYGIFTQIDPAMIFMAQMLYALPLAVLVATLLARLSGPLPAGIWIHASIVLAMTCNLFPRTDWGHLVFALPPTLLHIFLLAGSSSRPESSRETRSARLSAGLLTLAILAFSGWMEGAIHGLGIQSYWGPNVRVRPVSQMYRTWSVPRVIDYIRKRTRPGEPIFVARSEPLLYFATGTRNLTPFGGVLPVLHAEQEEKILAALPQVRYVVMSDIDQPIFTYYSDELPQVQAYLERYFRIPADFPLDDLSWIIVLEPGSDRGVTTVDLLEDSTQGQRWTLDLRGTLKPATRPPPRMGVRQNRRPLVVELGPRGGGIDFELTVPQEAVFQADIGFRGMASLRGFHVHPRGATMVVSLSLDGKHFETLISAHVDDAKNAGRHWTPLTISLARYAGQRVTLRLGTVADSFFGKNTFSWWGSPRIARPAS